ncbi:vacuolar protein sorting 16 [Lycorma delicatula]|uniref:vacuolar protein sorting 16 n=1 Tax=Lycorma delicatula TaxID=130591 RepID=UPI003F51020F
MTALLTADWCPYGKDGYFRKFEVYTMEWQEDPEINLDRIVIAAAKYGGPIAVVRDRSKIVKVQMTGKPIISIFSSSGKLISSFKWNSGQIVQLGWSTTEDLLCVQDDGCVLIYDMFSNYQHTFRMGQEAQDMKVIEAQIFMSGMGTTGVAVLTSAFHIFLVNSFKEPKLRRLPEVQGHLAPTAWVIISEARHTRVLMARGSELYSLNESETYPMPKNVDFGEEGSLIVAMAVSSSLSSLSSNSSQLAILSNYGKLWIGHVDLHRNSRIYDTHNNSLPRQLVWCGEDAVVIYRDYNLEVIDGSEDCLNYNFDTPIHLIQESDCVRVLSQYNHEILHKVPDVVQEIFRINSSGPGAYLLEASKQYQKRSHRADEYIHLVKSKLHSAVEHCILAAGQEFQPETQKMLIKASQFGKCFLAGYNPESYVQMCRKLRVLNAVRDPKIGIPITYNELQEIGLQQLLDMLLIRRQYFLAIQVAKHLQLPDSSRILIHWAHYKVRESHLDRETIANEIANKIGERSDVSYSEIAMKAADCGRTQLAIKLLDHEQRASLQVPMLVRLGQEKVALEKAIKSGNTDLVYTVLLHLRDNMPLGKFQMEIRNIKMAQALYLKYCREHNRETLRDVLTQEDDHNALAACFIHDCYDPKSGGLREASLVAAHESYKRAKNELNASFCDEQLKLRRYQRTLEEKYHRDFLDKSLHDTIKLLLMMKEYKLADKLRSEYKVPDRRYWWLRLQCLGELSDWIELEKLSKSKKSPVGYEPFVDICLKYDNKLEAQKYMPKIKDEMKVKYFVKLGMLQEANQFAVEHRDTEGIKYVQAQMQLAKK